MPAIGSGSLFIIKDFQSRDSDIILNRYFYYSTVAPNTISATEVKTLWETKFATAIRNLQPSVITHDKTQVEELTSISNFTEGPSTLGSGALAGTAIMSFVAASFDLLRTTKETRSGFKRYAAGSTLTIDGDEWTSTFVTTMNVLAALLDDTLVAVGGNLDPVLVRRTFTGDPPILNPITQWLYNVIFSVDSDDEITTQNTRKRGRGA